MSALKPESEYKIVTAQINALVGDIVGNTQKIIDTAKRAVKEFDADLIVFPELTLTGYPPEDLLLRPSLERRITQALTTLKEAAPRCTLVIGYPKRVAGQLFNMAGLIHNGELVYEYAKQCLPNYQVFDEKRYFVPGNEVGIVQLGALRLGITVCEDIWDGAPIDQLREHDIDLCINLSASPYHAEKHLEREALVQTRARGLGVPVVFVNWVGGQDELVFDGASICVDGQGALVARAPLFEEDLRCVSFHADRRALTGEENAVCHRDYADPLASVYKALVLGVKDYVNKNGFKGVVLGLSGGIDSALTLAVAVDALGPDRVQAVMMPFRYTSQMSQDDALAEAEALGVEYHSVSIAPIYEAFMSALTPLFDGAGRDTTEENLQARSRGVLLMALSNKRGYLVLTTGNKSEMAVGYATLYGDMAGGLDVLKDVPKTLVFALARYRNTLSAVIPENVITRPPSAELAPDQKDEDSLPPYEILDQILELYVERDASHADIVAKGFDADTVRRVIRLVDLNEYKRRQAPIGIRISQRAFGRDRRYPITNGWHIGD